jgi:L-aspartate oxidase
MKNNDVFADLLVIGSGAAGGACALEAAKAGLKVIMITGAKAADDSSTDRAQGGIVSRPPDDTPEDLAADVIAAGDGLCNPKAVKILAEEGPPLVEKLLIKELGVNFSRDANGELDYTQEAAHGRRRILHVDDATGHGIEEKLLAAVAARPNITLLTEHTAVDLITLPHHATNPLAIYDDRIECLGAYVLERGSGEIARFLASKTMLAAGGLGQIYLHTTNSRRARGDGLAMAKRAGATLLNTEYIQFHPTAFFHRDADRFLISESLRGEGARLRTRGGKYFMADYHPLGDLAPRDIVARAIQEEMLKDGDEYVLLDLSRMKISPQERFPTIYGTLLQFDIDITKDLIPVVPAAHYFCGGVKVDEWGRTNLEHLYAIGETSCTGVHGANRLASTSLLEAVLWGTRAAKHAAEHIAYKPETRAGEVAQWHYAGLTEEIDPLLVIQDWLSIRHTMWNYAGILRTGKRLDRAVADLEYLQHRLEQFYRETKLVDELVGLRNGLTTALTVARAARRNPVSRGCHYRGD